MQITTLNDIYDVTCSLERAAVFKFKKNGQWTDVGITEFRDSVRYAATALRHLGVKPGDRVAILAENRPEWAISDFAILCNAAISVPIYPTLLACRSSF